ncbi:MAG: hypothetical protein DRG83_04840 [Deltaproteobacteria bacterium]|nr:MAG: hypothetical protein DRG83_04840 [Deltaproteobacteria bacterium]
MSVGMNILKLSQEIVERYRRYLLTTFAFRDPTLRAAFENVLNRESLSRGPYVEATPPFRRGLKPSALFRELFGNEFPLDEGFVKALYGDRPLYKHQEIAIRKVVKGQNIIVATGTGSGKTEAFLYPILLHLYREFLRGELCPGVRALILYPMNALAHDQRERLGTLCDRLRQFGSPFRFTFGQYIGETPRDENDSYRHAREHLEQRLPGELVFRREMQETPPHILLTNYSMLEYLLLRPEDSPLFDNGRARWWTFIVLDEAHQYRGTRGTEMALLIRRLKQRLREGGKRGPFRCIATSATILGGKADVAAVAHFAEELFGEPFSPDSVIIGETMPVGESRAFSIKPLRFEDYKVLEKLLEAPESREAIEETKRFTQRLGLPINDLAGNSADVPQFVGKLLRQDPRVADLNRKLGQQAYEITELAEHIFPDLPPAKGLEALSLLLKLMVQARDPELMAPLLSVRYHLFLRSLEGAFLRFYPQKEVLLDRAATNDHDKGAVFEIALCRACGQHYLVGRISGSHFVEAARDPGREDFSVRYLRPLEEDEEFDGEQRFLCTKCGAIGEPGLELPPCEHGEAHLLRVGVEPVHDDVERVDQLQRCSLCGYTAGGKDPVREVVYGGEGPHAVITTTLFQRLPPKKRRILAFADGRQEAAYFAWYLENSYRDIFARHLLFKALQELLSTGEKEFSLADTATTLQGLLRHYGLIGATATPLEVKREAWRIVYRELLTDERRLSLEGVGLIKWWIKLPEWIEIPSILQSSPWNLSMEEAKVLLQYLLDTLRQERAIELTTPDGVNLQWEELGDAYRPMCVRLGRPRGNRRARSWEGFRGRRSLFLQRLLAKQGIPQPKAKCLAEQCLKEIWDVLNSSDQNAPSTKDKLLVPVKDAKRLNPLWFRIKPLASHDLVYICDTCGQVQNFCIRKICTHPRCKGTLIPVPVGELPANHYRVLYQEKFPGFMRVEEHTAQLNYEKAREYQRDFKAGKIHVLSCSTTFELGVDLGDLDIVFLRNVPPEPFNYTQRVGRSGRRSEPGFALTYCRRSSHDLHHFREPKRLILGQIRPPCLSLHNEKLLRRHILALVLSNFFRTYPDRFRSVEFFVGDWNSPDIIVELENFLRTERTSLETKLREVIPPGMENVMGIKDGSWINHIIDPDGPLSLAIAEACSDYKIAKSLELDARNKGEYKTASWAQKRARTIAEEDVLSFLSRKAVIPKYGFPVDVVELDVHKHSDIRESEEVVLQRDLRLAIAEFAPSAEVIANKKLWKSYGLKKLLDKTWPVYHYKLCPNHNTFVQWTRGEEEKELPCGCRVQPFRYVIPRFGFITKRGEVKEPKGRTRRLFSSRPYFAGSIGPSPGKLAIPTSASNPLLILTKATPGRMVVLCEGRQRNGFYLCDRCGFGTTRRGSASHKTPYGEECDGELKLFSLGHEFTTDILQLEFLAAPHGLAEREVRRNPLGFAYSLAYAIVEAAAQVLEIPSSDLNTVVIYRHDRLILPILLYDDVPGGAGLVARLEDASLLRRCLELALERVDGMCGCGELSSCYGCLRSYRNQFVHDQLRRGPVRDYLESLLSRWTDLEGG